MNNVFEVMTAWSDGLISDGEALCFLSELAANAVVASREVSSKILRKESEEAEKHVDLNRLRREKGLA